MTEALHEEIQIEVQETETVHIQFVPEADPQGIVLVDHTDPGQGRGVEHDLGRDRGICQGRGLRIETGYKGTGGVMISIEDDHQCLMLDNQEALDLETMVGDAALGSAQDVEQDRAPGLDRDRHQDHARDQTTSQGLGENLLILWEFRFTYEWR